MGKIWINRKFVAKFATVYTVGAYSLLGFISTFSSLNEIFKDDVSTWFKLLVGVIVLCIIWLIFAIFISIWVYKKKWFEVIDAGCDNHVYVQYGDVFGNEEIKRDDLCRNIVIPVNLCFDTLVDNDLISERTLHGMIVKRWIASGVFTAESLNDVIQEDLKSKKYEYQIINENDKRSGNLKRYPVGAVAEIKEGNVTYFLLGLSKFNNNLKAETTSEDYVLAMTRLIEYCYNRSQGNPIVMPIIGAGLSRTDKNEQDLLEYIIKLLKMNKSLIKSDVHIVVRASGKDSVSIGDLC